ncbi:MAG: rhamnulokinase [Clostridiaceae bacterium]|nr:rhamnulokinase [Clostridiaceae bacterium]
MKVILSFDFGASSGRAIISKYDGNKIELEEVHRFQNEPVLIGGHLYWDFLRLFHELKIGIKKAKAKYKDISSIGIDTWAVDYGLLDENNNLISNPIHYRDIRTNNIIKDIEKSVSFEEIYKSTGIQYMELNTLYQLYSDLKYRNNLLKEAKSLLFIPDLFNFYLTGNKYNEYTNASTSQMLDVKSKNWDFKLLDKLGLPSSLLQNIIMPGEVWGTLNKDIQAELEVGSIPVIAVGSHDTASAVAGIPLEDENSVYLICGTWSLLGIESKGPIINEASLKQNFTNEGGVEGTIRFLKNINGLWILQQLKKAWCERVEEISFPDIIKAAKAVKNNNFIIDPNNVAFMAPLNIVEEIKNYCAKDGQGTPSDLGEVAISVYNGLTNEFNKVIDNLEEVTGKAVETINLVGGGIQDELLCQLTADVTGKKVITGPLEASVFGNAIMQLKALGEIKSLEEGRAIIKRSIEMKEYIPKK